MIPEPEADPIGYIRYVTRDIRCLVENAAPRTLAITSRLDDIETALGYIGAAPMSPGDAAQLAGDAFEKLIDAIEGAQ